jgi:beta-mannosidase
MISCKETGEFTTRKAVIDVLSIEYQTKAELHVSNESLNEVKGIIKWELINSYGKVLTSGQESVTVPKLSSVNIPEIDFNKTDVNENLLWYEFVVEGKTVSSGSKLFTKPKYFNFKNPELSATINGNEIIVNSKSYARYVEIYSPDSDFVLDYNFFDLKPGTKTVKVVSGTPKTLVVRSVYDID